jgi:hypothetical protein
VSRFRTYVGINRSRARLASLLAKYRFARAVDVAGRLARHPHTLRRFSPTA